MTEAKESLRSWLLSDEGISGHVASLRRWSARLSFGREILTVPDDENYEPDWRKLLLAASILAGSDNSEELEVSLLIAHAAVSYGETRLLRDAGAVILSQLSNKRAVVLAMDRGLIETNLHERLGLFQQMNESRRSLERAISINDQIEIDANTFQYSLWKKLSNSDWVSATAPTATGKTYLVLNWLLKQFENRRSELAVIIAPTRALVGEIETQLLELGKKFDIPGLRIASIPLAKFGDRAKPTILILTQERLHLFFNACHEPPVIDLAIMDEAQKLSDGSRGVILQEAVEKIFRANVKCRFVFLTPHASNPEALIEDAPTSMKSAVIPSLTPTVTQNLLEAKQRFRKPKEWDLFLIGDNSVKPVGGFQLLNHSSGSAAKKKIANIALALGRNESATLVYANTPAIAENIATLICESLSQELEAINYDDLDQELLDLSEFCRRAIHEKFLLVEFVKLGVAFHYGNMPTILRHEIERLFRIGKIRFLVCTSTLIEGVNLACRTIILRGPQKGQGNHMTPQDFWNLAGRAGRWGSDFHGNIVCVDTHDDSAWPHGVPLKAPYSIERETETVIRNTEEISSYIQTRYTDGPTQYNENFESVTAYLMAWHARSGTVANTPAVQRLSSLEDRDHLIEATSKACATVDIPVHIIDAHPGVSASAMQMLLQTFRDYDGNHAYLLPAYPGDTNFAQSIMEVFTRINETLAKLFFSDSMQWAAVFTTRSWIQGQKLSRMINDAIQRERRRNPGEDVNYARVIRDTLKFIEEYARFVAPKYISAYLDILRYYYTEIGVGNEFPEDLPFDLYLEFGVSTRTLLTFISIGLSRTSSIEICEFISDETMTEEQAWRFLISGRWDRYDIPNLVKREIRELIRLRAVVNEYD